MECQCRIQIFSCNPPSIQILELSYDSQLTGKEDEITIGLLKSPWLTQRAPLLLPQCSLPFFLGFLHGFITLWDSYCWSVYSLPFPTRIQVLRGERLCLAFLPSHPQSQNDAWHNQKKKKKLFRKHWTDEPNATLSQVHLMLHPKWPR